MDAANCALLGGFGEGIHGNVTRKVRPTAFQSRYNPLPPSRKEGLLGLMRVTCVA